MNESETVRPMEIASKLGISVAYVYRMLRAKQLPGLRVGRRVVVPRDLWERWYAQQSADALAGSLEASK